MRKGGGGRGRRGALKGSDFENYMIILSVCHARIKCDCNLVKSIPSHFTVSASKTENTLLFIRTCTCSNSTILSHPISLHLLKRLPESILVETVLYAVWATMITHYVRICILSHWGASSSFLCLTALYSIVLSLCWPALYDQKRNQGTDNKTAHGKKPKHT